jgi:chromosome segregation ATPase
MKSSDSSSRTGQQPSGAMALLDKYATINNAIDEARRRSSVAQLKREDTQQRIQQLEEEKNNTELQTKTAVAEKADLIIQHEEAITKTRELKRVISEANMKRDAAERELEMARQYIEDTRRAFLKRCREFRFACKKLRISAPSSEDNTASGIHSSIRFSTRFPESPSSSEYEYEDSSEDEESLIFSTTKTIENQSISGNTALSSIDDEWENTSISNNPKAYGGLAHPNKRHPKHVRDKTHKTKKQLLSKANDEEMRNAEEKATSSYEARVEAKRGLDDAKVDHESAAARSNDRQKKLEQQRSQLNRVKAIVEDMEKDLASIVRETREAKQKKEDERRGKYNRFALQLTYMQLLLAVIPISFSPCLNS